MRRPGWARRRPVVLLAVVAVVGAQGAGCGPALSPPSNPPSATRTVALFAAASLGRVVDALPTAYGTGAGVTIDASTGASTALRVQIEQGARADLFLSADRKNPDALRSEGLADGDVVTFARTGLAIIVPSGNPARIASIADLGRPGVKVIAAGDAVPISGYAADAIARWSAAPGADPSFAAAYARNVVSREENVGTVVAKVRLGEGDAAIVYATDASRTDGVESIALPPSVDVVATYAGAVPTGGQDPAAGHALLAWLAGADGQAFLAGFGYRPVP